MANLLLVDDSPLIHRVVELTFEGQDFSIHAAETPEQALAMARTVKPDIVVASAEMKGGGGAEICRRLRQEGDLGETPVLLLTSAKSRMSEGEARQAGATAVLIKPFEPERLLAEVGRVLARIGLDKGDSLPGAEPPKQESPAGRDLFEDHELDSLFAGGSEQPAEMPPQAQDDSGLLLEAEKMLDQGPAAGATPQTAPREQQDVRLFDDSELEDLFAEEAEEKPGAPAAPQAAPSAPPGEEWADLDLEDAAPKAAQAHGDLADLAHRQANAAEAQLAELEAELLSGGGLSEDDVRAAESRIENIQEELSRELAGAGDIEMNKPAPESAAPDQAGGDDDLLGLAAEAGFGGPGRREPEASLPEGEELDLDAELAASGVSGEGNPSAPAPSRAELDMDDLMEANLSLPDEETGGETPVWDIPLKAGAPPSGPPSGDAGVPKEEDLEPLVRQSLERTVEAIVPALIRNIEALVVRQLPDLVEKIVLREIEKIKRGE